MESGFDDKQAVADFLATVDRQDYTGWQALGELSAVTGSSDEAPAAAVEGVGQEEAAVATPLLAAIDAGFAQLPSAEHLQAEAQAAIVEPTVDTPAADTYLPAEVAHEAPPAAEGQP